MNRFDVCEAYIFNYTFYAGNMFLVLLNKMNLTDSPGSKLIAYAAGPCFETRWRNKPPAPVFAADYPQLVMVKRFMNL